MENRPSRLRIIGARLFVAIAISPLASGLWMLAQQLIEGIHPLDRWHYACVYGIIGAIAGTIVGLIWGIGAALDNAPASVKPPGQTPDAPPESN